MSITFANPLPKFFKKFAYAYQNAKFIIIGNDEGFKRGLEKRISEYGIQSNVQIYEFILQNLKHFQKIS